MWRRNLLFFGLLGSGVLALGAGLMPPQRPKPLTRFDAGAYQMPEFHALVASIDASFHRQWTEQGLRSAAPAPELAVVRRAALGLMGSIPSLEEIRQLEYLPIDERLPWWIDHILQDRRFADHFAERFARAFVGTEDGPF